MKRCFLAFIFGVVFVGAGGALAYAALKSHVIGATLTAQEAERRWGARAFDASAFKEGSIEERANMASDLLRRKHLRGLAINLVRERLGDYTGYFWNDQIPAYLLNEGWKSDGDVWQLVFLPGRDGKVDEIIINKNCCDRSSSIDAQGLSK